MMILPVNIKQQQVLHQITSNINYLNYMKTRSCHQLFKKPLRKPLRKMLWKISFATVHQKKDAAPPHFNGSFVFTISR